jgi:two-component system response regulator YesN
MAYNILIVDDESTTREALSCYIPWNSINCRVLGTAKNGREAVDIIKKGGVDVVITDIKMPLMSGIELANFVNEYDSRIKVIILTGYAEFEFAQAAIRSNVADYILKPISSEKVLGAVERVTALSESERHQSETEKHNPTVGKALAFIKLHFQENLSLEDIAAKAATVPTNLSRLFNKEMHTGIPDYINSLRVEDAKKLMQNGNMAIYEIAEAEGYSDTAYFSKIFKKFTGQNPREWRNR